MTPGLALRRSSSPCFLALAATLAGFALRAFRLGHQELRGDETFGYFFSLNPPVTIVSATLELREPHPPLSYLIERAAIQLFGPSEFVLRFASLWFGVLSIALVYIVARRVGLRGKAAALAAALLAFSPYALWHSQDARMYSMSLALTLASSALALGFFRRPRARTGLAYVLLTLLALLTHYYAVFVLAAQNLWFLWRTLREREFRREFALRWIAAQAALFALYLPWLIVARATLTGYGGNGDSPALLDALARTARALAAGEMAPPLVRTAAALVAAVILVLLLVALLRREAMPPRNLGFALFLLLTPILATWLSSRSRPIFNERYLVAAAPGLFILLAAAVDRVPRAMRRVTAPLLVAFLALSLVTSGFYLLDPDYSKSRGWRELATQLRALSSGFASEQAWVVANAPDPTLWYYYPKQAERWAIPPAPRDAAGAGRVANELVAAGVERVIVPLSEDRAWDGDGIARDALATRYTLMDTLPAGRWQILVAEAPPAEMTPLETAFAGGLRLDGSAIRPSAEAAPGGLLGVHLAWSGHLTALPPGVKITLQLLDANGALAAQVDNPLAITNGHSSHALRLPPALSGGTYRLIAALYDADAAGMPRLLTEAGQDAVTLGEIRVP